MTKQKTSILLMQYVVKHTKGVKMALIKCIILLQLLMINLDTKIYSIKKKINLIIALMLKTEIIKLMNINLIWNLKQMKKGKT